MRPLNLAVIAAHKRLATEALHESGFSMSPFILVLARSEDGKTSAILVSKVRDGRRKISITVDLTAMNEENNTPAARRSWVIEKVCKQTGRNIPSPDQLGGDAVLAH